MNEAVNVVGTVVAFGSFGVAVFNFSQKKWVMGAVAAVVGIAILALLRQGTVFGAEEYLDREQAFKIIDESRGKIIHVTFRKKDGSMRVMRCRVSVRKGVKGVGSPLGDKSTRKDVYNLITVFDMDKGEFRQIKLDRIIRIRAAGETHTA